MNKIIRSLFLILFVSISRFSFSQNVNQQSAWLSFFHSQRLNTKTGLHFDAQLRSADDLNYVRNILIRPGFTYFFDDKKNATIGYAFILTNLGPTIQNDLIEHRIWQQLIITTPIGKIPLVNRFRLEQRFIETNTSNIFSQRIRYFARAVIPFQKQVNSKFSEGAFFALQNEIFLNLQNKDLLNNKVFDQNRSYVALGYRLNAAIDLEIGYLNQFNKGLANTTTNHVFQVGLYTRFK
jgi:hypothetical protein